MNGDAMRATLTAAFSRFANRTAIVLEDGRQYTYRQLEATAHTIGRQLSDRKSLVVVEGGNNYFTIASYVGALIHGHVVHIIEPKKLDHPQSFLAAYRPDFVVRCTQSGFSVESTGVEYTAIHEDLTILFTTSGSTASSKLVKITAANIVSNSQSIIQYLSMTPEDRAITVLKPSYSYGLSIINTHLLCGGSLLLTDRSLLDPIFWSLISKGQITNFSGVPYTFETIANTKGRLDNLRSLRFATQAGGKLHPDLVRTFARASVRGGWQFFVMYGQTEASPRISYLPPELAIENPESIGISIPGGRLEIVDENGVPNASRNVPGELIYYGPNVMAGYAFSRDDLVTAEPGCRLATGDLAVQKPNGLFVVTGRKSRFVKPLGIRISLDEIEQILIGHGFAAAALPDGENIIVYYEKRGAVDKHDIERLLNLPPRHFHVQQIDAIPRLSNGKVDYVDLSLHKTAHKRLSILSHPFLFCVDVVREMFGLLGAGGQSRSISSIYQEALQVSHVTGTDSFVSLGGDSLSYVEVAMALEDLIGPLPDNWHLLMVHELDGIRASQE